MKASRKAVLDEQKVKRRTFLKGAAVMGTAVGSGVVASQATADVPAEIEKTSEKMGYRETDHIREYYKSARF